MARWKLPTKQEMRELRIALADRARHGNLRFPGAVAEIRKAFGMTHEQFGTILGMTRRQIAEIENGRANPTLETTERIGRLFGFTVGDVPKDEPDGYSTSGSANPA